MPSYSYQFLIVEKVDDFVVHVKLNRPNKLNALNDQMWREIGDVFIKLEEDKDYRVVILSGDGKAFTTGMDLASEIDEWNERLNIEGGEVARPARRLRRKLAAMKDCFTRIEKCTKPDISAIHGYCFADGMAIISACDIRHCTKDAVFSINETNGSICPDMGTLNRIPKIIDLVNKIYENKEDMIERVTALAKIIATRSPVAVQGSKVVLNYSRDHTVDESLNFVATWNQSQLFTEDIPAAKLAVMTKAPPPPFSKL